MGEKNKFNDRYISVLKTVANLLPDNWRFDEIASSNDLCYVNRLYLKEPNLGLSITFTKKYNQDVYNVSLYSHAGYLGQIGMSLNKSINAIVKDLKKRLLLDKYYEQNQKAIENKAIEKKLLEHLDIRKRAFLAMLKDTIALTKSSELYSYNSIYPDCCYSGYIDYSPDNPGPGIAFGLSKKTSNIDLLLRNLDESVAIKVFALINEFYN